MESTLIICVTIFIVGFLINRSICKSNYEQKKTNEFLDSIESGIIYVVNKLTENK